MPFVVSKPEASERIRKLRDFIGKEISMIVVGAESNNLLLVTAYGEIGALFSC